MITKGIITMLKAIARLQRRRTMVPDQVRAVLLLETTRLGDVIALLPVIPRLQLRFPNARITLAISERFAPLMAALDVDVDILPLGESNSVAGNLRSIALVRSRPYDLACSMSPSRRNALLALASRSLFRIGYLESRNSVTPFLESTPITGTGYAVETQDPFVGRSIYERPHFVANAVHAPIEVPEGPAVLRGGMVQSGMQRLRQAGFPPSAPFAVIHPFALWEYRAWDVQCAAELSRLIAGGLGLQVVVVGSVEDFSGLHAGVPAMVREAGAQVFISGDLRDTALLVSQARVFVGSDSGPLHLAAALGIPVVGLYGPASPQLTAPPGAGGVYLYHQLPCSPCAQRSCSRPEERCMSLHLPRDVYAAVARLVREQARVVANA